MIPCFQISVKNFPIKIKYSAFSLSFLQILKFTEDHGKLNLDKGASYKTKKPLQWRVVKLCCLQIIQFTFHSLLTFYEYTGWLTTIEQTRQQ